MVQLCFTAYPQSQTSQYSLKMRIHYHSSGNKHIHILVLRRRILACQKLYVSPNGGGGDIFLYLIKSLYQSTSLSVSESVCVCVWMFPNSSGTAGPIWLNFFWFALSWSHDGFRPKKIRIQDLVFPEIRILGYYSTNLAEKPLHV